MYNDRVMRGRHLLKSARAVIAAVALAVALLPQTAPAASPLLRLRGIQELKSWFNTYRGHPRLILLLSPT
jgi:hypothetical protein